jgi:preprotein translocase subunit YajC
VEAILPLVLILAAFYLLILGPRRAQARRAADLKANLRPGVEIITTAGVVGTVTRVDEDEVQLEIAPGVVIRLLKGAVGKILDPDDPGSPAGREVPGDAIEAPDAVETTDDGGKGSGPASSASH